MSSTACSLPLCTCEREGNGEQAGVGQRAERGWRGGVPGFQAPHALPQALQICGWTHPLTHLPLSSPTPTPTHPHTLSLSLSLSVHTHLSQAVYHLLLRALAPILKPLLHRQERLHQASAQRPRIFLLAARMRPAHLLQRLQQRRQAGALAAVGRLLREVEGGGAGQAVSAGGSTNCVLQPGRGSVLMPKGLLDAAAHQLHGEKQGIKVGWDPAPEPLPHWPAPAHLQAALHDAQQLV